MNSGANLAHDQGSHGSGTAGSPAGPFRWLPAVLVVLGPILLFGPMVVRGEVLYWGTPLLQFNPWRSFAFELIREGIVPLWNPRVGMGAPLLANYQSALLYPANWLLAVVRIPWGEGLLVLLHLAFAGIGMTALMRRLGLSPLGQVIGGISFASGSFLVARSGFLSLNAVVSWLPWLVLTADWLGVQGFATTWRHRLAPIVGLAVIIALMSLAGHAQTMLYGLLLALAWSAWKGFGRGGLRGLGQIAGLWMISACLGLSVAAAQLLPTAEYLLQSSRAGGLEPVSALTYSFWPWRTLGLLLPGLFGSPVTGDYWGYGNFWEDALYLGVLPLLMAVVGAGWAGRLGGRMARLRTFLLIAAGVSFVFALGQNTFIYAFLFRTLAPLGVFNAPTRWNLITTFALAILAGIGADLWSRPSGRRLYWTRLATAGAFAMLGTGILVAVAPTGLRESFGRSFALAGMWLGLSGVITLLWPREVGRSWVAAVGLLVTLDLVVANRGLNPAATADLYLGTTQLLSQVGQEHRLFLYPEAEEVLKFERTHRFDTFAAATNPRWIRESGLPNTPMLDQLGSANNFDPLVPGRYQQWVDGLQRKGFPRQEALLASMDVGWYAFEVGEEPPWIQYLPVASPRRTWVAPAMIPAASDQEAIARVMEAGFDPFAEVVIEGDGAEDFGRIGGPGEARIVAETSPLEVQIAVDAPQGGWLVLADVWYPGWSATIDGHETRAYPANGAFRGVWVPPGDHSVVWTYRPRAFQLGIIVSALGLVVLGILGVLWFLPKRSG